MNATDVRAKTDDDLRASLSDLRKEAFNLRFQKASGQLEKRRPYPFGTARHRANPDRALRARSGRELKRF